MDNYGGNLNQIGNICRQGKKVEVLRSNAGYYIGTLDDNEPNCRLSMSYYEDAESAQFALDNRLFSERESMEIQFCNNSIGKCLI